MLEAKKVFIGLFFISGLVICPAAIASTNVSGHITEDTTWDLAGSPYIITGDVYIDPNVLVNVESGVDVQTSSDINVDGSLVLSPSSRLYLDRCTLTVNGSMTVTNAEWVHMDTFRSSYIFSPCYIYVYGSMSVTDTPFSKLGNFNASIQIYGGGSFTATASDIQIDGISFNADSSGSVSNGNLASASVGISDDDVELTNCTLAGVTIDNVTPNVTGNTLTGGSPVHCRAEYFPFLQANNTFSSTGSATVHIQGGTVNQDTTWGVFGSVNQYQVESDVVVANNMALTVGSGVGVQTSSDIIVDGSLVLSPSSRLYLDRCTLTVNGSMTVTNAEWVHMYAFSSYLVTAPCRIYVYGSMSVADTPIIDVGGGIYKGPTSIQVYGEGSFTASDIQVDGIGFSSGCIGSMRYCSVKTVSIHSDASITVVGNDFSSGHVYASGDPAATINLENNWWGTTDPGEIENKITHHVDYPSRPWVDFEPFFTGPPPQDQPIYTELDLPAEPNKLVFITHGWNNSQNDFNNVWIPFKNAIQAKIDERSDANEWVVRAYPWIEGSNTSLTDCYNNAMEIGQACGTWIANKHYKHVHLIASSAGSALIGIACEWIEAQSPTTETQVTFLDPYAPWRARDYYGYSADWAENYFSRDIPFTGPTLPYAHNVDITLLNANYPYTSIEDTVAGHYWPRIFYKQSVSDPNGTIPGADSNGVDYGFCRSLEGGGWTQSQSLPIGNDPIVLPAGPSVQLVEPTAREDPAIDISSCGYFTSGTGTVHVNGTAISLDTESPVWIVVALDVNQPISFVSFDANFTSEPNAEGLLSVYWGEEHLGNVDERYVLDGFQNYSFELPGIYQPNSYVLKLRVDSFSSTPTTVIVDNISTGLGTTAYDYKVDGRIDFLDFAEFALHWAHTDCNNNNNWCDRKDLDESGIVDLADIRILASHWLEGTTP